MAWIRSRLSEISRKVSFNRLEMTIVTIARDVTTYFFPSTSRNALYFPRSENSTIPAVVRAGMERISPRRKIGQEREDPIFATGTIAERIFSGA